MSFTKADNSAPNPNFSKGGGYTTNCQSCVVTYELRRRGFNVETLANYKGGMADVLSYNTNLAWIDRATGKNPQYITPAIPNVKKTYEYLQTALKTNHRYTIEFEWKKSRVGHIIHIYNDAKKGLMLYDPQNAQRFYNSDVLKYLYRVKPTSIQLLDVENCDINLNVVNKILRAKK